MDLILLDVMMPTLGSTSAAVCASSTQEKLPVLLLTALNQPKEIEEGFNAGANDYLVKPFCKEELFAQVPGPCWRPAPGRASLVENRLLKQGDEHRLLLQEQLHQDRERLLALFGEGPTHGLPR